MKKFFKKIIDFSTEHYETKSNNGFWIDGFHIFLWITGWCFMAFAAFMAFVFMMMLFYTIGDGFKDLDALLLIIPIIIVSLTISYWFKKLRVKLFYKDDN